MPHCNKRMLSFFLTTKCNLCCRYCYNAEERSKVSEITLPFQIAKASIDWYFSNQTSRHIRFYGPGEPTREFGLLKQITEYARNHPKSDGKVTVELQTNGVFTDEVCRWLLNNANIIWMSFDGMKAIQDNNRPLNPRYTGEVGGRSSGQVLEDNVKWLNEHKDGKNLMVGARATITKENVDRQIELVDYFASLGIQYIWSDPLFQPVGAKPVCNSGTREEEINLDEYVEQYIRAKEYADSVGLFYGSFLAVNFDGQSEYHCRACTPLPAPHITPDGYISACDMVVIGEKPHHMSPFIVGKYEPNGFIFFTDKIKELEERKSSNILHCIDCPVKFYCGGYCLGETVNETGILDGQCVRICEAIKKLYQRIGNCHEYKYLHP